ncbi:MAG: hypothetical protein IJK60_09130 [Clostridia bacterium]|nr:hypothetical protein [Clostridia bacterium]
MKKAFLTVVSVVLVVSMVFGMTAVTAQAQQSTAQRAGSAVLGGIVTGLLGAINGIFPDAKSFIDKKDFENDTFYGGTEEFLDEPAEGAAWKLGYANTSLVPDDWKSYTYYLGGYIVIENLFTNNVEYVIDDMKARVIAIEDGSGRGVSVFATIDCIGMTNGDIKKIRQALVEKADGKYDFAAINVESTHAHSCIDTEGLWTNLFGKMIKNMPKALFHIGTPEPGTDEKYMTMLYDRVSDAMLEACDSMVTGTMTYARKDIGEQYFDNKNRSSASALMTDMVRLAFTPDDETVDPTYIINMAAHPDVAGLATDFVLDGEAVNTGRQLSGEYPYYMGETLAAAGVNCMFFNGAIAGIYIARGATNDSQPQYWRAEQSARYGQEMAKIALAMTMTLDEIKTGDLKDILYNEEIINKEMAYVEENGGEYTLWCENWEPVEEVDVDPLFNIVIKEVFVPVTNPLIILAGKLNLANYKVLRTGFRKYEICTEIGYIEFGRQLKAVMMPGEVVQDIVAGGSSLTADGSYSGKDFEYAPLVGIFGDEDLICFGLANDAVGYIVPDNDYCMCIAFDHYQELISLGSGVASAVVKGLSEIAEEYAG